MSRYLLGIDYGTGGAKACVINTEGRVLSYAFREYPIITRKPGWSEHDPHLYWQIAQKSPAYPSCLQSDGQKSNRGG